MNVSHVLSVAHGGADRQLSTVVETTIEGDVLVGSTRERVGFDESVDAALGPITGRVLADGICGATTDLAPFDPDRFQSAAIAANSAP